MRCVLSAKSLVQSLWWSHYSTRRVLYDLHADGMLPENQWTMFRKDIITMLTEPGGNDFWERVGQKGVHEDFRVAVNEALANDEVAYEMV
jgi:hypothetical protein